MIGIKSAGGSCPGEMQRGEGYEAVNQRQIWFKSSS